MNRFTPPYYSRRDLDRLEESEIVFPFNDDDAIYDSLYHQYELTPMYFAERGRNLAVEVEGNDPEKVKHFLRYLRIKFYTWIYAHNSATRREVINYIIAKRGLATFDSMYAYRQAFLEAMFLEGCYLIDNGDLSQVAGVDLDTMQNMSADVMRNQNRDMHRDVISELTALGLNYKREYRIRPIGMGKEW